MHSNIQALYFIPPELVFTYLLASLYSNCKWLWNERLNWADSGLCCEAQFWEPHIFMGLGWSQVQNLSVGVHLVPFMMHFIFLYFFVYILFVAFYYSMILLWVHYWTPSSIFRCRSIILSSLKKLCNAGVRYAGCIPDVCTMYMWCCVTPQPQPGSQPLLKGIRHGHLYYYCAL